MFSSRVLAIACGGVLAGVLSTSAASAYSFVQFHAGSYDLSRTGTGGTPTDLLTISISAGVATFTVSGDDTASWQLPQDIQPDDGYLAVGNPVFSSSVSSASWSTATFPYVTFWTSASDGGLTIAAVPGDPGTLSSETFVDLFTSTDGPGQVFTAEPEPAEWALMLTGFAGLGAALRARREKAAAA